MKPFWRRRLFPVFLVLLSLNAAVFGAFTLPRTMAARSMAARGTALRAELDLERARAEAQRRRAAALQANREDHERFYRDVVGSRRASLVPLLRELGEMATRQGLRLRTQQYARQTVKGARLTRFAITLPIRGTYAQLVAFLESVERSPRFVTVDRVNLVGREQASEVSLDVEVSAYFPAEAGDEP